MKKLLALVLALVLCVALFAGCTTEPVAPTSGDEGTTAGPVTIKVVTSYGGDDGNRGNYEAIIAEYEAATGNKVSDQSGTANEDWKAQVHTDFEAGQEPDVLFFFNGVDSEPLVKGNKLVGIEEIRAEYPDFASNMDDARIATSAVDGKAYFVPTNGFWEAMFVNTKVLADAGVTVPGGDYTMEAFMADCQKIKDSGVTPIAASLNDVPHYWFEFVVINHTSPANHLTAPAAEGDAAAANWAKGLDDIKALFDAGYFPANTATSTDAETCQLFFDGAAAFLIDGSWKTGAIVENCPDTLADYDVVYPPSVGGDRKASDLIGGISMGYAITRKAWDSDRRDAAVEFIKVATSDANVSKVCGAIGSNALKAGSTAETQNVLEEKVVKMVAGSTSFTGAVQDGIPGTWKDGLFKDVINVCEGTTTSTDAVNAMLALDKE